MWNTFFHSLLFIGIMKNVIYLFFLWACLSSCNLSGDTVKVWSPDGKLCASFFVVGNDRRLLYEISYDGENIINPSTFGIIKDSVNLGKLVKLGQPIQELKQDYFPIFGNHSEVNLKYVEMKLPVSCMDEKYELIVRIYNTGVAIRSNLFNKDTGFISGEDFEWALQDDAVIWFQTECHGYEGLFTHARLDTLQEEQVLALPVTAKLKNNQYLLLTEADVIDYSDMALKVSSRHTFQSFFHANPEGWHGKENQKQPWRVVLVANDLNELVNNDIIYSLASPTQIDLKKESWIRPGRATWQWWSSGEPILSEQKQWLDWTAALGFEYYLIDDGWKMWKKGNLNAWQCLKEVVDEANKKGIGVWLWVHSNEVDTSEKRIAYFEKVKQAGVVGIKIDFMPPASVKWINWYDETLRDALVYKLMVDFHGAVKPSGRNRTWPHEMTREAVRGHEWHILRYQRSLSASHDCILPFNRYVQGFADYTPTVLNPEELRGFTWSREIAQAVIFTSPFLCYADCPDFYLRSEALDLIKQIPSVWDETRVLSGSEIGECAIFARRKGDIWFLAAMNGMSDRNVKINFSFLKRNEKYKLDLFEDAIDRDDAFIRNTKMISFGDNVELSLRSKGGFVGILQQLDK